MHPTRRRYLQCLGGSAVVGSLAGCRGTETSDTRPTGTGGPGITIAGTDGEVELPIQPAVEIVRATATANAPPQLRTTLTNTSDETVTVGEGRAVHFQYVIDESDVLIFLPSDPENNYPAEPDCWRLTEGIATTEEYRTFPLEAGMESGRRVDLYATPDADGCLPVGEYRFETTLSVVGSDAEPEATATWGFSVTLE